MEDKKTAFSVRTITYIGMFAAILAVMSQISIPMPGGVPVTIQVFAVTLTGTVLGSGMGTMAVIVYILLGIAGLPIFANFQGGIGVLMGTAGGYMVGWLALALLSGITVKTGNEKLNLVLRCILAAAGLAVVEGLGALWWCYLAQGDLKTIIIYSFAAFIPKDIIITFIGVLLGGKIRKILSSGGLL